MALRQGFNVGRSLGGGALDGIQRSDYRMVQGQLNRIGRHLDPVTGVQGTARYPMRIGKPVTVVTYGAYILSTAGGTITFVGDYFDRITGVYFSCQGNTTSLSTVVTDEQHLTVTFDVASAFGQMDVFIYDNGPLWPSGNTVNAIGLGRLVRIQPLEQQSATLCYRAPNFIVQGGNAVWFSSERANGNTYINNYPATVAASGGPTMAGTIGGAPIFNASTAALTQADSMANWLNNTGVVGATWYVQAVVDLANITSTTAYRALEPIIGDTLGQFGLGFFIDTANSNAWTVAVTCRCTNNGGAGGYLAKAALPSNGAQRVIVQARLSAAGLLGIRLNGGAWVNAGTAIPGYVDIGGSLLIGVAGTGTSPSHFQGTIWFLATYGYVPADSTFCNLMYALHNVNYPPTPIKLLDLDSRYLTLAGTAPNQTVTAWLDQSGNGWNAALTSGATQPVYKSAFTSKLAPTGYNNLPAVQYKEGVIESHETSDSIAASIGTSPITIFVVGHIDQSIQATFGLAPSGNQYFVMTKAGNAAGVYAQYADNWGAYAGVSAPIADPVTANRRSMIAAVLTNGDTTRLYLNSKLPATYGSTDPITNYPYITNNLTLATGLTSENGVALSPIASGQGETNRTIRGGGYLQGGITYGFRIGNWQSPAGSYSPAGVILRVIVYLGALTQPQIEAVLATLETTYGVLIEDEVANEAGTGNTGAWDAGPEVEQNYTDSVFSNHMLWLGKSTRAFTLGQNFKMPHDNPAPATINGLNAIPHGSYELDQVDTALESPRVTGAVFAADGSAGSAIIAFNANSASAFVANGTSAALMSETGGVFALEYTTSGLQAFLGTNVTPFLTAPTATNHIALVSWDGTNLKIAVNASSGTISWQSVSAPGGLHYLSGVLRLACNYYNSVFTDATIGAVRTYRHALTDAQFNAEAVPIQNNLNWSNGFTTAQPHAPLNAVVGTFALSGGQTYRYLMMPSAVGAFTRTNNAATLSKQSKLSPSVTTFNETGGTGGALTAQHRMNTTVGTFALAGGTGGTLTRGAKISPSVTTFAETGNANTLTKQSKISPSVTTFAETGNANTLTKQSKLSPSVTTFAETGNAATLTKQSKLSPSVTTFAETGNASVLTKQSKISPSVTPFAETGNANTMMATHQMQAANGSYALVGNAATKRLMMPATVASFAETGSATALYHGYKVNAVVGTFVETGNANALYHGYKVNAVVGTFAETGNANALYHGYKVNAVVGTFAETGSAAGLYHGYKVNAVVGTFAETGSAAGLYHGAKVLTVVGAFAESGQAATFQRATRVTAVVATFAEVGNANTLTKRSKISPSVTTFSEVGNANTMKATHYMPVVVGTFAEIGSATALYRGAKVLTVVGVFAETGFATTLSKQSKFSPSVTSFALVGNAATRKIQMPAAVATFAETGNANTLTKQSKISPSVTPFALTGFATSFPHQSRVTAVVATFALVGGTLTTLMKQSQMTNVTRTYAETGNAAALYHGYKVIAVVGTFAEVGNASVLTKQSKISPSVTPFAETGNANTMKKTSQLQAANGSYAEVGYAVTLSKFKTLSCAVGSFALTGIANNLYRGAKLSPSVTTFSESGSAAALYHGYKVLAVVGTFAETGSATGLYRGAKVSPSAGVFTRGGGASTLTKKSQFAATSGTYSETGNAVTLSKFKTMNAVVGTFAETGNANAMTAQRFMTAGSGAYVETGYTATYVNTKTLNASIGSFALAGYSIAMPRLARVTAVVATYNENGGAATLTAKHQATMTTGAFTMGRPAASLAAAHALTGATRSYALTGFAATKRLMVPVTKGSFALIGNAATRKLTVPVTKGTFTETGNANAMTAQRFLSVDTTSFAESGSDVSFLKARKIYADAVSFAETGIGAFLFHTAYVSLTSGSFASAGGAVALLRAKLMNVDAGSFIESAGAGALARGRGVGVSKGTFTLAGTAVSKRIGLNAPVTPFVFTGSDTGFAQTGNQVMFAETGRFTWNAQEKIVGLYHNRKIFSAAAAFAQTGYPVVLGAGMPAATKPIALAASASTLKKKSLVAATVTALSLAASVATFKVNEPPAQMGAGARAYALTGASAGLTARHQATMSGASFIEHASDITIRARRTMSAIASSFIEQGRAAQLFAGRPMNAIAAGFVEGVGAATFKATHLMTAIAQSFVFADSPSRVGAQRRLAPSSGSFTETGGSAAAVRGRSFSPQAGYFAATIFPFGIRIDRHIEPGHGVFVESGGAASFTSAEQTAFVLQAERGFITLGRPDADLRAHFLFTFTLAVDAETTIDLDDGIETSLTLETGAETTMVLTHDDLYDVGDVIEVVASFNRRRTGGAVDPDVIVVLLQKPDGTVSTITDVTRDAAGIYAIRVPATLDMVDSDQQNRRGCTIQVTATGQGQSVQSTTVAVRAPRILV